MSWLCLPDREVCSARVLVVRKQLLCNIEYYGYIRHRGCTASPALAKTAAKLLRMALRVLGREGRLSVKFSRSADGWTAYFYFRLGGWRELLFAAAGRVWGGSYMFNRLADVIVGRCGVVDFVALCPEALDTVISELARSTERWTRSKLRLLMYLSALRGLVAAAHGEVAPAELLSLVKAGRRDAEAAQQQLRTRISSCSYVLAARTGRHDIAEVDVPGDVYEYVKLLLDMWGVEYSERTEVLCCGVVNDEVYVEIRHVLEYSPLLPMQLAEIARRLAAEHKLR